MIGREFDRLLVVDQHKISDNSRHIRYICRCTCGNIVIHSKRNLVSRHVKSCGCLRSEKLKERWAERRKKLWLV